MQLGAAAQRLPQRGLVAAQDRAEASEHSSPAKPAGMVAASYLRSGASAAWSAREAGEGTAMVQGGVHRGARLVRRPPRRHDACAAGKHRAPRSGREPERGAARRRRVSSPSYNSPGSACLATLSNLGSGWELCSS